MSVRRPFYNKSLLSFLLCTVARFCLYRVRFLWYYDIYEGTCTSFFSMECIDKEVYAGSGNPLNKFDSLRECRDTCYCKAHVSYVFVIIAK